MRDLSGDWIWLYFIQVFQLEVSAALSADNLFSFPVIFLKQKLFFFLLISYENSIVGSKSQVISLSAFITNKILDTVGLDLRHKLAEEFIQVTATTDDKWEWNKSIWLSDIKLCGQDWQLKRSLLSKFWEVYKEIKVCLQLHCPSVYSKILL